MQADAGNSAAVRDIGPWILSLAALMQVWIIAAWKKLRKGRIAIFESGVIEIGYGNFGPSVGLLGTLQALDKDIFVKSMQVHVVRRRDNATHTFNWRTFRPRTMRFGDTSIQEFELASSFLVRTSEPYQYSVFFVDDGTLAELKPQVDPVQNHWLTFKQEKVSQLEATHGPGVEAALNDPITMETLYTEFSKTGEEVTAFSALTRGCYWDPGEYSLVLEIECASPARVFTKEWQFTLTDDDTRQLRLNAITVLRGMAGLAGTYAFAYPAYETPR